MSSNTYSISKLSSYEKCPRQFRYRYIDHERGAFDSIEAFMGSRVHDVVEWMYTQRRDGTEPTLADACSLYERRWIEEYQASRVPIRIVKQDGSTQSDYAAIGRRMVCAFHPEFLADKSQTIAIEKKVVATIGGKYEMLGYIDRLADVGGVLEVQDFKTSKHTPDEFIGSEADQLRFYALALMLDPEYAGLGLIDLRLIFLRSGKHRRGMFRRTDVKATEQQLLSRIKATEATPYTERPSTLCGWCGFNDRCEGPKKAKGGEAPLPF